MNLLLFDTKKVKRTINTKNKIGGISLNAYKFKLKLNELVFPLAKLTLTWGSSVGQQFLRPKQDSPILYILSFFSL